MRKSPLPVLDATPSGVAVYVSPKELTLRWRCSRSQVDRIARREGLKRMLLGHGRNGMVRYVRAEVESLENRSLA
jgi:hypothetical protein